MDEIWKSVIGYEGLYEVSSLGRVKSLKRQCKTRRGKRNIEEKIKNLRFDKDGYLRSSFSINGKVSTLHIHRLVAEAFIPNPNNKSQVNHKNGIKNDNRLVNLEWNTQSENMNHSLKTGLNKNFGQTHYKSKLTEKEVFEIRYNSSGVSQRFLAVKYKVCFQTISQIKTGMIWKHV